MRNIWTLALVGLLGVAAFTPVAFASDETATQADEPLVLTMETTSNAKLDGVFDRAKSPIETLDTVRADVKGVNTSLVKALDLKEGTPFKDALADLQTKAEGKIDVAFDKGKIPTFKAQEGVPENVQQAVDALNTSFGKLDDAEDKLSKAGEELLSVAEEASNLISKPKDIGLKGSKLLSTTKATNKNVKTLKTGATVTKELVTELGTLTADVKSSFGG